MTPLAVKWSMTQLWRHEIRDVIRSFSTYSLQSRSRFFKRGIIYMSNLKEKLSRFIESVDCWLDEINRKLESRHSADVRTLDGVNVPPNVGHVGTSIPLYTPGAARLGQSDLQGDFQALRDTLSKVKLPAEVWLNDC